MLIAELKRTGHAIVYISHFIEEVKEVADRIVVLRDGRVAGGGMTSDLAPADIVGLMVGRPVDALYPRSPRRQGAAILDVAGFGPSSATFTLHRGEILGIAGLLGAGRTRLVRGLFGLEPVRTGRVRLGAWSGTAAPHERWRMGCGFLSEDRKEEGLAAALSIADNMTLSKLEGLGPGPMVFPRSQDRAATQLDGAASHQVPQPSPARRRALGRQPAEGGDRPAAPSRRRRPSPRRTNARHRRREQGANLRAHRRARF